MPTLSVHHLQTHFTSSESAANKYVKETEKLQEQLIESDSVVVSLRQQLESAKFDLDKLTAQGIQDKVISWFIFVHGLYSLIFALVTDYP